MINIIAGIILPLYAIFGMMDRNISIPRRRREFQDRELLEFSGQSSVWAGLGLIVAGIACLIFIIDYSDNRDNKIYYQVIRWLLFGLAFIMFTYGMMSGGDVKPMH